MGVRHWSVRLTMFGAFAVASAGALYAQPSQGDKEIGVAGSLVFQNSSPVSGSFFADFTGGKYFKDNQYLGVYILPSVNFTTATGGASVGTFGFGGEYEYGFKRSNDKLWPFVGGAVGGIVSRAGGFGSSSWSGGFQIIPEAGIKYFLDQKTSLDIVFQVPIEFASGGTSSSTQILFGFRHIL
jgi:hypothetical protein